VLKSRPLAADLAEVALEASSGVTLPDNRGEILFQCPPVARSQNVFSGERVAFWLMTFDRFAPKKQTKKHPRARNYPRLTFTHAGVLIALFSLAFFLFEREGDAV
jgi:hypothetical protein